MQRAWKKILGQEWEKALLGVSALLLLAFCLTWALGLGLRDSGPRPPGITREYKTQLADQAFAFLHDVPPPEELPRNPFAFETEVAERRRTRPAENRPTRPRTPPPPNPPTPQPTPPVPEIKTETPPPRPSPPRSRLRERLVSYLYTTTNQAGKPVVFIQVADPDGSRPMPHSLAVGDQVDGIHVQRFTDQAVVLLDAAGRRHVIPFGEHRRILSR